MMEHGGKEQSRKTKKDVNSRSEQGVQKCDRAGLPSSRAESARLGLLEEAG